MKFKKSSKHLIIRSMSEFIEKSHSEVKLTEPFTTLQCFFLHKTDNSLVILRDENQWTGGKVDVHTQFDIKLDTYIHMSSKHLLKTPT